MSADPDSDATRADVRPPQDTQLEAFLRAHRIKPAHLARESGYSRQHLLRLRLGRIRPSILCIAALVLATRRLTGQRVTPPDLFAPESIRAAWRDTRASDLEPEDRDDIQRAFGRRTLRELLGGQA